MERNVTKSLYVDLKNFKNYTPNKWYNIYECILCKNENDVPLAICKYISLKARNLIDEIKKIARLKNMKKSELFHNVHSTNRSIESSVLDI